MTDTSGRDKKVRSGRGRRIAVALLLIVASVLAPLSVIAVWTKNTLLDTDQYVSTVAPLAKNPAIIDSAAAEITDSLVSEKNVEKRVKDALPPRADFIAPAVAGSLKTVVNRVAVKLLSSDRFATLWERANRRAHTQVVDVLTGNKSHRITTSNGEVAINLGPAVTAVRKKLSSLGISAFSGSGTRVSPRFVLVQSDELKSAQSAVNLLQKLSIVLPALTLLLYAGAIGLSRKRRKTVMWCGLGLSIGMLVILTAFNVGRAIYLDAVTTPQLTRAAAQAAYDQLLSFLRFGTRSLFLLGVIVAIAAWLSGPSPSATKLRTLARGGESRQLATAGFAGWVARSRTGIRIVVIGLAAVVLVTWSHPKALTVLVIAILVLIVLAVTEIVAREPAETVSTGG